MVDQYETWGEAFMWSLFVNNQVLFSEQGWALIVIQKQHPKHLKIFG